MSFESDKEPSPNCKGRERSRNSQLFLFHEFQVSSALQAGRIAMRQELPETKSRIHV
jgi:hypothetical protein